MPTAAITSQGQVTISAAARNTLDLHTSGRIAFIEVARDQFVIMAANLPVTALKWLIRKPKSSVSIKQMNAVIAKSGATVK